MSILKNAIDSIVIGVEDYQMTDERRLLSATRNIFAGILLLFKHKLSEMSPVDSDEVLIKQQVLPILHPTQGIVWEGKGKKTVDVAQIRERCTSLEISIDWNRIEKINKYRNNIEHYYSTESSDAIKALISDCFIIIRDFISTYLEEDPKELLGAETWNILVSINEVYIAEKQECIEKLALLDWFNEEAFKAVCEYSCDNCSSDLITVNDFDHIICKSCEKKYAYEDIIVQAINDKHGYYRPQDGEDPNIAECPFCQNESYLMLEGQCMVCGEKLEHSCDRCGADIGVSEINDTALCGYCLYMRDKYMDEDK